MAYYIKKNGELEKIAGNVSISQADWNETDDRKFTKIKNKPEVLGDKTSLMNNNQSGKLVDALAIKEALDYQNIARDTNGKYSTLEEFVEATNTYSDTPRIGRCCDISSTGWTNGIEPFSEGNQWYRYIIIYSARYQTGNTNDIHGNGVFWHRSGKMYNVLITGNKDTGLTLTYEVLNKPTIKTKNDLMANKVSGLFPDALAVKDAINGIKATKFTGRQLSTLEEFINLIASSDEMDSGEIFKSGIVKDLGGWGPAGNTGEWYKYMLVSQNHYKEGNQFPTTCQGIFMTEAGKSWVVRIYGKKGEELKLDYTSLSEERTQESIDDSTITITLNDVAKNAGLLPSDFTVSNITVVHYGGLNHRISFGLQCRKTIPANTYIDVTFNNAKFNKNLSDWGGHPVYGAYASIYGADNVVRCIFTKETATTFTFWPVISYGSNHAIRTVKI